MQIWSTVTPSASFNGRVWSGDGGTQTTGSSVEMSNSKIFSNFASGSLLITCIGVPGFTRGLALLGPYAFLGLSKIRPTSAMDGVPLAERRDQLKCGVGVVDLRNGRVLGLLEFQTAVEEIFDVQLLPGLRFPEVIGFQKEAVQHTFIIPPKYDSEP